MIQEVVGTQVGRYYLPAFGGVAFSNNEFRWSPRISARGRPACASCRASARAPSIGSATTTPSCSRRASPGCAPTSRPRNMMRYSPKRVDLINLDANRFATVLIADLLKQYGSKYPMFKQVFSAVRRATACTRSAASTGTASTDNLVATLRGPGRATRRSWRRCASLLRVLREKIGGPVDIEFAHDGTDLYLLQCRPQSAPGRRGARRPSRRTSRPTASCSRPGGSCRTAACRTSRTSCSSIPRRYAALGDLEALRDVGRAVGRLNKLLPKRQFVLMGPGRWGSRGDIKLGVPVTYSDISNTALLIEIASRAAKARCRSCPSARTSSRTWSSPSIRYLPLYPDEDGRRAEPRRS